MRHLLSPAAKLLIGVNVLLAIAFVYELSAPQPAFQLPKLPLVRRPAPIPAASYAPPSAEAYTEIERRPLFNASRRAPKVADAAASERLPPPTLTLVGIMAGGQSQTALAKTQSPAATVLNVGSRIDGWEVTAIHADRIVLHSPSADYEVRMNVRPGEQAVTMIDPRRGQTTEAGTPEIR
jgi:hypothetical protein